MKTRSPLFLALLSVLLLPPATAPAQGTAFTYQGRLDDGGQAANGIYDLRFTIYDALAGSSVVGEPVTNAATPVTNGVFTVTLDFGDGVFAGAARWLDIAVRANGAELFTELSPRQPITPSPYAISAGHLSGTLPAAQLTGALTSAQLAGTYSSPLTFNNGQNVFNGTFAGDFYGLDFVGGGFTGSYFGGGSFFGDGHGLYSLNASLLASGFVADARLASNVARVSQVWLLTGNTGTTPGTQYLGTDDDRPLELKVYGVRALRLEPANASDGAPNVIGGSPANSVANGVEGAVIAGGGAVNYSGLARSNTVRSHFSFIGAGNNNLVGPNSLGAFVGGGTANTVVSNSPQTFIGGGIANTVGNNSPQSTIGGGSVNSVGDNSLQSTIGGGAGNDVGASAYGGTVGGGNNNNILANSPYSTISGGSLNDIGSSSTNATIAGGLDNNIGTSSAYSTIGGGSANTVGNNSTGATIPGGRLNTASGSYTFAAGYRAYATNDGALVWSDGLADTGSTNSASVTLRASGGYRLFTSTGASGVYLAAGDGSWTSMSDRNAKENLTPVNAGEVLARVAALPLTTWNYRSQDAAVRHLGPMAQDFHAAFGLGETDTGITAVDADGVALAAIQGLNRKLEQQLQRQETENAELKHRVEQLEELVRQLAR